VGLFLPQVLGSRFGASPLALGYNLIVTNVPGPMIPQYFLESLLFDSYPLVPITSNQALGIALYTYNGVLHWGFHADWDALPDLHDFVLDVDAELSALVDACRPIELRPARKSTEPTAPEATARASTRGRRPRKPRPPEIAPDAG
jgi:hypothetical protein